MDHLDFRYSDTHSYSQYFNVTSKLGMGPDELAEAFLLPKDGVCPHSPAFDITHAFNPTWRWTHRHQMSVNGKFDAIRSADFEAIGDSDGIPNYKSIISCVLAVVSGWKRYTDKAGVLPATRDQIATDFAEHRP